MVVAGQAVVAQLVVGACLLRLPMNVLIAAAKFKRDKFCSVSMVHEPDEDSMTVRSGRPHYFQRSLQRRAAWSFVH